MLSHVGCACLALPLRWLVFETCCSCCCSRREIGKDINVVSCGVHFGETGPTVSPGFAYRRAWRGQLGGCCEPAIRTAMSILADGTVEIIRATESCVLVSGLLVVCKAPAPLPGCGELAAANTTTLSMYEQAFDLNLFPICLQIGCGAFWRTVVLPGLCFRVPTRPWRGGALRAGTRCLGDTGQWNRSFSMLLAFDLYLAFLSLFGE